MTLFFPSSHKRGAVDLAEVLGEFEDLTSRHIFLQTVSVNGLGVKP